MAGICGIILSITDDSINYNTNLEQMINALKVEPRQKSNSFSDRHIYFGSVDKINSKSNSRFVDNSLLGIYTLIDGMIFIEPTIINNVQKKYNIPPLLNNIEYIPYLYNHYGTDFLQNTSGWYNVFIYDKTHDKAILVNDVFGYIPVYYFNNDAIFAFSTRIESLLASQLIKNLEIDHVSITEHLLFNYCISNHTFVKNIATLPNASIVTGEYQKVQIRKQQWKLSDWFNQNTLNKNDSLQAISNGLDDAIQQLFKNIQKVNFALTGGWDSRLLLAYLKPFYANINTYSFGAEHAPDITVPAFIASDQKLPYTPILLDNEYLNKQFVQYAKKTIALSGGTRNLNRTHYLYAMSKISDASNTTLSGIFGDELFKISSITPNAMFTETALHAIKNNFDTDTMASAYKNANFWKHLSFPNSVTDEFIERINNTRDELQNYESAAQRYLHFRLLINLRKYFGAELNSYNDYTDNYSPFISQNFIKTYLSTKYSMLLYPFNSGAFRLKKNTTQLYGQLIKDKNKKLLLYNTDRGYTIHDALSLPGQIKIILKNTFNKQQLTNVYSTAETANIFLHDMQKNDALINHLFNYKNKAEPTYINILSLSYWIYYVQKTYNISAP